MKVVDTSFLIVVFDADDRRHASARAELAHVDTVLVGPEVLVETLGVLKAKAGRGAADQALEDLMRLANIEWGVESDIVSTYRIYTSEAGLSFVDASVVRSCLRHAVELLTFDERQAKAVKRRLGRRR